MSRSAGSWSGVSRTRAHASSVARTARPPAAWRGRLRRSGTRDVARRTCRCRPARASKRSPVGPAASSVVTPLPRRARRPRGSLRVGERPARILPARIRQPRVRPDQQTCRGLRGRQRRQGVAAGFGPSRAGLGRAHAPDGRRDPRAVGERRRAEACARALGGRGPEADGSWWRRRSSSDRCRPRRRRETGCRWLPASRRGRRVRPGSWCRSRWPPRTPAGENAYGAAAPSGSSDRCMIGREGPNPV